MADLAQDLPSRLRELIGNVARQDRQAFTALYDLTAAQLFGVALRILGRRNWRKTCCRRVLSLFGNARVTTARSRSPDDVAHDHRPASRH
jgi:hypothetical protein